MPSFDNSGQNNKEEPENNGYPDIKPHTEEILIIVKTAPVLSKRWRETVCTAGITKNGKFIRLSPVLFRYLEFPKRYKKYQWVRLTIEKNKADTRIDSYFPHEKTIQVIGNPLPAGNWKERKGFVLPLISQSLHKIEEKYKSQKISLGIFKPEKIELKIERADEEWSAKGKKILRQLVLLGEQPKNLEKIPYKFSYEFTCSDKNCKGHKLKIIDWEISEAYRAWKAKNPYQIDKILGQIKQKWETDMWKSDRDSYLIVGTYYPFKTFLVLGVFWPPK